MSSSRPKLMLDEQSFQDMLEAAFTIQEHNAKRRRALQPQPSCSRCGEPVAEGEKLCRRCAGEEPRPGEKLQQKWASMWLKGQEQGLWPEAQKEEGEGQRLEEHLPVRTPALSSPPPRPLPDPPVPAEQEPDWTIAALDDLSPRILDVPEEVPAPRADVPVLIGEAEVEARTPEDRNPIDDLRLILRFHRADFYLVVAIVVSTFAMLWVLLATPSPAAQSKPGLRPWERAMVNMGLAEAPEPPPQTGNPAAQVWADPKTALYYCQSEDQFGKTAGGYSTTQRDAQLNAFQPAGRAPCQ